MALSAPDDSILNVTLVPKDTEVRHSRKILEVKDNIRTARNNSLTLKVPSYHLNINLETFSNQAPRLFNQLPDDIKDGNFSNRLVKKLLCEWVKEYIRSRV